MRLALGQPQPLDGSGQVDWSKVTRELTQLHPVLGQLGEDERLPPAPQPENASVAAMLRDIATTLQPLTRATGREIELELSEFACLPTIGDDLRAAMRALIECALSMGTGAVRVTARIEWGARNAVQIEVLNDGLDVTDPVRRKLAKAVGAHAGQTAFVSAKTGSCVRITLPAPAIVMPAAAAA
jgi:hypothetical protein